MDPNFGPARFWLADVFEQKGELEFDIAMIHVGNQETDEAFSWLQKALEQRCLWLGYLIEPQFDSLRQDHRFHELLQGVGLARAG